MDNIILDDANKIIRNINFNELDGKNILITGASGLIGTYFLYTIYAMRDNGCNPLSVNIVIRNELPEFLKDVVTELKANVYKGDLSESGFMYSLPVSDYIIHAAGYGQPAKFVVNADKTLKLNTVVTFTLLDKLNKDGKFLFISSSTVYSGLIKDSFVEDDIGITNTLHPRACYIEGKKCGETIVNAYRLKGINAKSARLSYTYGPGVRNDDDRVLYTFIRKARNGRIDMLDSGASERIYCYISDAIEMLWNILLFGKESLYNVGGKDKITILEIAKIISDYFDIPLIAPDNTEGFLGSSGLERLDISRYEYEFSKKSFVPVKTGIHRTIEWFEDEER